MEGKRCSAHCFRHFFAVQSLTGSNIDLYSLSRLLGHSDVSITQRYLSSISDEQLSKKTNSSSPLMNMRNKPPT
ncbi:tyrosine-type recombinase/integrase [Salipaludibacillus neizhouensis]|uniref:tyrosine-type recombinase/integrase n=1 Tax=Salipaludibacillus neizhouensis TaxID=885475 RepID=UPI001CBA64FF|nr:tyrosine-type recombinase/integrase [Salipaludibacillus neizhouensis]